MFAGAFSQRNHIVVPLPPMQCGARYPKVFFQTCWSCNLARSVFNAHAMFLLILRLSGTKEPGASSRLPGINIQASRCFGRELVDKVESQGG